MPIQKEVISAELQAELHFKDELKDKTVVLVSALGGDGRRGRNLPHIIISEFDCNVLRYIHPSHQFNHFQGFREDYKGLEKVFDSLDEMGLRDNTLVGTSYGAFVALDYLARKKNAESGVNKLFLLEPLLGISSFSKSAKMLVKGIKNTANLFNMQRAYWGNSAIHEPLKIDLKEFSNYVIADTSEIGPIDVCTLHAKCPNLLHKIFDPRAIREFAENMDGLYVGANLEDFHRPGDIISKYPQIKDFILS